MSRVTFAGKRQGCLTEGVKLSGVPGRNEDCRPMALWRSPCDTGAEGAKQSGCFVNLSGKRTDGTENRMGRFSGGVLYTEWPLEPLFFCNGNAEKKGR